MGIPPYWHLAHLTSSFTPVLNQSGSEVIETVVDNVGLYQGEAKILHRQQGRLYVTNERLIYVDSADPVNYSVFVKLCDAIEENGVRLYGGFLKLSPKITVQMKDTPVDEESVYEVIQLNGATASKTETVPWKCKICGFQNSINSGDYNFQLVLNPNLNSGILFPKCEKCGIQLSKSSIVNAVRKYYKSQEIASTHKAPSGQCSACTFVNRGSLTNCEVCATPLSRGKSSVDSQNVLFMSTEDKDASFEDNYIKISFRGSRNGISANSLKRLVESIQSLIEAAHLKIMLANLKKNTNVQKIILPRSESTKSVSGSGILALEESQKEMFAKYDHILGSSLEDLTSLMEKAKELRGLVRSFDRILKNSNVDTSLYDDTLNESRQVLGLSANESFNSLIMSNNFNFLNKLNNKELFYRELARNISSFIQQYVFGSGKELITDEYCGGIISLIDLYSLYNRSLGFNSNLISPSDLLECVKQFEKLKLPLKFRRFDKTGLMVIQDSTCSDEQVLNKVVDVLIERKFVQGEESQYHTGITIQALVRKLNLSGGILQEILDLGLMTGLLTIDEHISGTSYFLNEIAEVSQIDT